MHVRTKLTSAIATFLVANCADAEYNFKVKLNTGVHDTHAHIGVEVGRVNKNIRCFTETQITIIAVISPCTAADRVASATCVL